MKTVTTCLSFKRNAHEAVNFYISLFKNSNILQVTHYGERELKELERLPESERPGPVGSIKTILFTLNGIEFLALNGGDFFSFNHSFSLMVKCDTQLEIDELWEMLGSDGGKVEGCGWIKDKYGVSWQVIPAILEDLIDETDFEKSQRVSAAIYNMKKLDIEALRNA